MVIFTRRCECLVENPELTLNQRLVIKWSQKHTTINEIMAILAGKVEKKIVENLLGQNGK